MNQENADETNTTLPVVGWRERVSLPEWGVKGLVAKVDTGARTSAIHVENIRHLENGRIHFELVRDVNDASRNIPVETEIVREAVVKPSSGHPQSRPVVETTVRIGSIERRIELTLVSRRHMLCRMLLGRRAVAGAAVVDAGRRYVQAPRKKKKSSQQEQG